MRRDALFVTEMLDAAQRIIELVGTQNAADIEADRGLTESLLWNFTVLGEASGQVSSELRASHPDVPWADPVRMRNRIVHGYWSVMIETLVTTAQDDLPSVANELRLVLAELPETGDAKG